jgi:hypothetical protein
LLLYNPKAIGSKLVDAGTSFLKSNLYVGDVKFIPIFPDGLIVIATADAESTIDELPKAVDEVHFGTLLIVPLPVTVPAPVPTFCHALLYLT